MKNCTRLKLNFNGFKILPAVGGPPISLRLGGRASMPMAGGGIFGDDGTVPEVFYKKKQKINY